ncbi:hypothetical protein ABT278_38520 [Streptomyces sp. NPDC001228]|uniref:hypothetical protein n=1 Tax=Streptomyces sp. NPDC001228 TaxID=3154381 RepID=UPI0033174CEB
MPAEAAQEARAAGHVTSGVLLLTGMARLGGAKNVRRRLAELVQACEGSLAAARARFAEALAAESPEELQAVGDELASIRCLLPAAAAASVAAAAWQRSGHASRATAAWK